MPNSMEVFSILDLINIIGEDNTLEILSGFSCPPNMEIENYLKKNAISFAKRKMSITYLLMDMKNKKIIAFFTLSHKPVLIPNSILSNTSRKKIERYARIDEATDSYTVSAFLIAQFGKNYSYSGKIKYTGNELMDTTVNKLTEAQDIVGGGVIFLECEDNEKLLSFYQNEHNNYQVYGERISESENITYKQLLRFF